MYVVFRSPSRWYSTTIIRPSSLGTRSALPVPDVVGLASAVETNRPRVLSVVERGPAAVPVVSDETVPSEFALHANASRMTGTARERYIFNSYVEDEG